MLKVSMISHKDINILIIGFGAQANAWALNLRDSGIKVTICLKDKSQTLPKAQALGFTATTYSNVDLAEFNFLAILTPDHTHVDILNSLKNRLHDAQTIILAHGFSFHYHKLGAKFPKQNFALLAPKAIASEVRFNYETKRPLCAVIDECAIVHEKKIVTENFHKIIKSLGVNISPINSTFEIEAKADLFSEQSILCSLIPYGARLAFEKLLEKGIPRDIAYIECWHEVKLIADAMMKVGPSDFFKMISPNALLGSQKAQNLLFDDSFKAKLELLFNDINEEKFFKETLECDFDSLRINVANEWKNTELQKIYETLGKQLGKINS